METKILNFTQQETKQNFSVWDKACPVSKSSGRPQWRRIRILHVIMQLGIGGIETWLMQVLRHLDRSRFQIDIMVHWSGKQHYTDEAVALGAQIHVCPDSSRLWIYAARFFNILRKEGGFDVIHDHMPLGGYHILLARLAGIPVRIYHCHNDETTRKTSNHWRRRFSLAISHGLAKRYATHLLPVSRLAGVAALGASCESDDRWQLFPAVNDLFAFTSSVNRQEVRSGLGLPDSAFVIGHVGRFQPPKNHDFLIDVVSEVCRKHTDAYLLLVGDGPLRSVIEDKVARMQLADRVIFAGTRRDIPALMQGAMDVFLFPSTSEGMGMAILEAQAAGLPCIISDVIPKEIEIIPELVRRISLADSPERWAEGVLTARRATAVFCSATAAEQVRGTLLDIETNVRHLEALYQAGMDMPPV